MTDHAPDADSDGRHPPVMKGEHGFGQLGDGLQPGEPLNPPRTPEQHADASEPVDPAAVEPDLPDASLIGLLGDFLVWAGSFIKRTIKRLAVLFVRMLFGLVGLG